MLKIWKLGNAGITIKVGNNHLNSVCVCKKSTPTFYSPSTNNYQCPVQYSPNQDRFRIVS